MTQNVTVYDRESICNLLKVDDAAVARAVLALYARQTADEQQTATTAHSNGRGFNHRDAKFLTSIAKALPKWGNHMTNRQLEVCRDMLPKYWRQLLEIFNEGIEAPAADPAPVERPRAFYESWF